MKKFRLFIIFLALILFVLCDVLLFKKLYLDKKDLTNKSTPKIEEKVKEKEEEKPKKISLVMVGDSLIHEAVYNNAKNSDGSYDFKKMFTNVKPLFANYDLAYYNQESILGGKDIGVSTYPRFNSPYEVGDAFIDMGFNLVSLANNHTLDRGEEAIVNSLAYWKSKENVVTAGSYSSFEERDNIKVYEKNGIKYAFLAYTTVTNGLVRPAGKEYYLNVYNEEQVKKDVESIRDKVDVVLVSMHWGQEYTLKQVAEQETIANYLASLNVDIVIGAHPHVIEPITYIDDTLVIYSLGNFISGQTTIDQLTGLVASVDIVKYPNESKIKLENVSAEFVYTKLKNLQTGRFEFEVIPYNNLSEDILSNYKEHKEKYTNVVNSLGANVIIK